MSGTFRIARLLTVAALVLSGCIASRPIESSAPASNGPPIFDPFALHPELVNCQNMVMAFKASGPAVKAMLPPGYEPEGAASAAFKEVQMDVDTCESIIINNETVIPNAGLLLLHARVRVNESLSKGADFQRYALEILSTNQTIVNLLQAIGLKAGLAEFALQIGTSPGSQSSLRVNVAGQPWYEVTSVRWNPEEGVETTLALRNHQVSDLSGIRWLDYNRTYRLSAVSGEAVFRVDGGAAKAFDAANTGHIPAEAWVGVSHGPLAFGRL